MTNYKSAFFVLLALFSGVVFANIASAISPVLAQQLSRVTVANSKKEPVPVTSGINSDGTIASMPISNPTDSEKQRTPLSVVTNQYSQTWEYRNITIDNTILENKDSQGDSDLIRALNKQGSEGFELVSLSPIPSVGDGGSMKKAIAVLKRPKNYNEPAKFLK